MEYRTELRVRELESVDIDLIMDYWFSADKEYLEQMGADINKLPSKIQFRKMLLEQLKLPLPEKKSYALIWELNGKPIGHSNVNNIKYGRQATMHLHLWEVGNRKRGLGTELIKKSLSFYFGNLKIKTLICEPYALNTAPNKTLNNVGFDFIKKYRTFPGSLNFEQEVNRWELTWDSYSEWW